MKKAFALLTVALLSAGTVSAQDFRTAARAGASSLNFTFGGFGAFGIAGAGVAGGLSYSHFPSSDVAYRIGLQAAYQRKTTPWSDNTLQGSDFTSSSTTLGVGFDYLMYMNSATARVRPYWGPGVSFLYTSSKEDEAVANNAPTGTLLEKKNPGLNDGLTVGVMGVAGAEFFLYPELSLSAEYNLNLFSITSNSDYVEVRKNAFDVTTKQGSTIRILGFGAAGAGLHIYF